MSYGCTFNSVPFVPNVAPADFRLDFPAFSDPVAYSDEAIDFWIGQASLQLSQRWSTVPGAVAGASGLFRSKRDLGVMLYVAHQLALEAYAVDQAKGGAPPIGTPGVIASKAVGPASVGYDVSSSINPADGYWNQTLYGRRFAWMMRLVGAGPIQLGIGVAPPLTGPAWSGPPWPVWFS